MKNWMSTLSILFVGLQLMTTGKAKAQGGSVGVGTFSPDQSAILDVSSSNKGVLFPRMTRGQRDAIPSPATGLLIYQTDETPGFYYYMSGWQAIASSLVSAANRSLSNLTAPTSVNVDFIPSGSGFLNIGSQFNSWRELYLTNGVYLNGSRYISSIGSNNYFGTNAGNLNNSGENNTAVGNTALANDVSGFWNTAVGFESMNQHNGGFTNSGFGYRSLYANTNGLYNSAIGGLALSSLSFGNGNTAVGMDAMFALANGSENTSVGHQSGVNFSGTNNTFIGAFSGSSSGSTISNSTAVGNGASVSGSNMIRLGNSSVSSIGGQVNWTALSDGRYKQNVVENVPGLSFINRLRPVTYNLNIDKIEAATTTVKEIDRKRLGKTELPTPEEVKAKRDKGLIKYSGFIAQEVEAVATTIGYKFSGVDAPKNSQELYGLRYAEFVVPLVKAVQELSAENDAIKKENALLRQKLNEQSAQAQKQQDRQDNQEKDIQELKKLVLTLQRGLLVEKSSNSQ